MGGKFRRRFVFGSTVAAALLVGACRRDGEAGNTRTQRLAAGGDAVARGKYLVTVAACGDCHTPFKMTQQGPQPDMARLLSGHPQGVKLPPAPRAEGPWVWHGAATNTAFAGPWGVTYAINLTPHAHGMAAWTEEMFIRAMRTGKHMGEGRPIMPPMPWQNLGQASDEDLRAMFAYLKTVPPVNNVVPDYEPAK